MSGIGTDFSTVLNLTLKDVEEQLGATEAQLRTMDMEEILKQLYTSNTLDTLPSFMRAPSWQQQAQAAADGKPADGGAAAAPPPQAWEAAAAAGAAAAAEQQAAAAQAAAAGGLQLPQGGVLPLNSVRLDQIFSWYAENAGQGAGAQPQAPQPTMTLSQLFDTAGLQLAPPGAVAAGTVVPLAPGQPLPGQLAVAPGSGMPGMASLHAHMATHGGMLPAGVSPAGPFASLSLPVVEASLAPPASLAPGGATPPGLQPSGAPPKGEAAAARAARARKRKAAGEAGAKAGPLSAAEAAKQALEVAERAAAELAELPDNLDGNEARAIKRAIKNRESAARSRAKRQEYTATLEQQVEQLKQQNTHLRHQVVAAAPAPPDPHAPTLDGELLRRSRTGPI